MEASSRFFNGGVPFYKIQHFGFARPVSDWVEVYIKCYHPKLSMLSFKSFIKKMEHICIGFRLIGLKKLLYVKGI